MEIYNQYINLLSVENMSEVKNMKMKMKRTPRKLMLGIGMTAVAAAAAVAMTPVVKNMMNNKNFDSTPSDNNSDNFSMH